MMKCFGFFLLSIFVSFSALASVSEFKVDKKEGFGPLIVTFDASGIKQAKKYTWAFGNGEKLETTKSIVSYQYKTFGVFTASLLYQVNASEKNPNYKEAGSIQITVKNATPAPNQAPIASLTCSVNNLLVNCNAFSSYDPENQPLVFTFDYNDGFSESNTTGLSTHSYAAPGLYTVRLSVFDSAGANGDATTQVQAVKPPNKLPTLALNCSSTQINTLVCDANGSTDADGTIVSYSFAWDDSITDTNALPSEISHAFTTSGAHSVTLTAVDNDGGVSNLTKSFAVKANTIPIANFTCDNSKSLILVCTSTSTDPDAGDVIQSYAWKFGTSSEFNSTTGTTDYSFSSASLVVVTLTVTDSYGGKNSVTNSIEVKANQLPTFDFIADKISGFAPLTVHFSLANFVDSDGTISSFYIDFDDNTSTGSKVVDHTFNAPGTFNVTATVIDDLGGVSTKTIQITANALVDNPPRAFFKIFEYDTAVELHATLTKTQYDIKRAFYTIDGGDTVELSEFYPNTINWVDLKNFGEHEIKLTVEDIYGEKSSFTHNFELSEDLDSLKPFVDFTAQQSAARTVFINLNRAFDFDIDQPIQSFHIDFGDGHSIDTTDLYATYIYDSSGNYPISVTAISSHRTQATITKNLAISDDSTPILNPTANFGYRIYDFAQNVSFYNDKSGTPNGSIISYVWDFGDGSNGSGSKVSHFYNPGTYFVKLTVVDSAGQTSSQVQHITVFGTGSDLVAQIGCDIAQPYFDFTQTCQVFALDKLNQISRVRVSWGDGAANNLTLPSANGIFKPTHKYTFAGTYVVTETVTTTRGEVKTTSTSLTLNKYIPIVADIQCSTNNLLVSCNALGSYDIYGRSLSYTFDYGDSFFETNSSGVSSHAYTSAGIYKVKVTVKNINGEFNIAETQVMPVLPQNLIPVANLNCNSTEPYVLKCISAGSYDNDGEIISYKYLTDEGRETTVHDAEVILSFSSGGVHNVTLTITDNDGGQGSVTGEFSVEENHLPISAFTCYSITPLRIHCDANSSSGDINDEIIEYAWNLDGKVIKSMVPSIDYIFYTAGDTLVRLTVTDKYNASSTSSQVISIKDNLAPIAVLDCTESGLQSISCNSFSYDLDGSIINTIWESDDGFRTDEANFIHLFSSGGEHSIKLTVTDEFGSVSSASKTIQVISNQLPTFEIKSNNTSGFLPFAVHFSASNLIDKDGKIISHKWFFGDGQTSDQIEVDHVFYDAGIYNVKFQVVDDFNGVSEKSITISASEPSNLVIISDKDNGVANLKVHFDASESTDPNGDIKLFEWFLGNRKIGEGAEIDYNFDVVGLHYVELFATNIYNVKTHAFKEINVAQPPIYLASIFPNVLFTNESLNVDVQLTLGDGISADNVFVTLENAPDGLTYDDQKKNISWTPSVEQVGIHRFIIQASDGILFFEKSVQIEVVEPRLIGNFSGNNETNIISNPNSILNGVEFSIQTDQDLTLYEADTENGKIVSAKVSGDVGAPIDFHFNNLPLEVAENVGSSVNYGIDSLFNDVKAVYYKFNDYYSCPNEKFYVNFVPTKIETDVSRIAGDVYKSVNNLNFWVSEKVLKQINAEDVALKLFIDNISSENGSVVRGASFNDNSKFQRINILLLNEDEDVGLKSIFAYHPLNSLNTIVVNVDKLKNSEMYFQSETVLHEIYHQLQTFSLNCQRINYQPLVHSKFQTLMESSAEFFALERLNKDEKSQYVKNEILAKEFFDINNIYEHIFKTGIFNTTSASNNIKAAARFYRPFFLWDLYSSYNISWNQIDMLEILSFMWEQNGKKINNPIATLDVYIDQILPQYASFYDMSLGDLFLDINSSFYFRPHLAFYDYNFSQTADIFGNYFNPYINNDPFSLPVASQKSIEGNYSVPVHAYGGNFLILQKDKFTSSFNNRFPTFIKVKTDVGVRARVELDIGDETYSIDKNFIAKDGKLDGEYHFVINSNFWNVITEIKNPSYLLINLANSTAKDASANIQGKTLCKKMKLPVHTDWMYFKVNCDQLNNDCNKIQQNFYSCNTSQGTCVNWYYMSVANPKQRLTFARNDMDLVISCQNNITPGKSYLNESDFDFSDIKLISFDEFQTIFQNSDYVFKQADFH